MIIEAAWRKNSTDDPREEHITAEPEEQPITEDSRRILLKEKPKDKPYQ